MKDRPYTYSTSICEILDEPLLTLVVSVIHRLHANRLGCLVRTNVAKTKFPLLIESHEALHG